VGNYHTTTICPSSGLRGIWLHLFTSLWHDICRLLPVYVNPDHFWWKKTSFLDAVTRLYLQRWPRKSQKHELRYSAERSKLGAWGTSGLVTNNRFKRSMLASSRYTYMTSPVYSSLLRFSYKRWWNFREARRAHNAGLRLTTSQALIRFIQNSLKLYSRYTTWLIRPHWSTVHLVNSPFYCCPLHISEFEIPCGGLCLSIHKFHRTTSASLLKCTWLEQSAALCS